MLGLHLLLNGIAVGALYGLAAVGWALIFWTTKVFHIAHGATYLIAAYAYVMLWERSVLLALVTSILCAAVFGYGLNRLVYRPIQRAPRESFFTLFVASFGTLIFVMNLISVLFGSGPQRLPSLSAPISFGFLQVSSAAVIGLAVAIIFLFLLKLFLENTETGVGLRALADDVELVEVLGLDRSRYAAASFIIGSVLIVPAAILTTYVQGLSPTTGLRIVIIALIVAIAGGVGSLAGAFLGAIILGVVENVGTLAMSSTWAQALAFSVLLAILVLRPQGIIPQASH